MNSYLKELADICGITKTRSMYVAFVTSATLANGVPIETISKMLNYTSLKTTLIYASADCGSKNFRGNEEAKKHTGTMSFHIYEFRFCL